MIKNLTILNKEMILRIFKINNNFKKCLLTMKIILKYNKIILIKIHKIIKGLCLNFSKIILNKIINKINNIINFNKINSIINFNKINFKTKMINIKTTFKIMINLKNKIICIINKTIILFSHKMILNLKIILCNKIKINNFNKIKINKDKIKINNFNKIKINKDKIFNKINHINKIKICLYFQILYIKITSKIKISSLIICKSMNLKLINNQNMNLTISL